MVALEKAGVPTATILSEGFQDDAYASAKAFGLGDIKFTVVPKVYNNITVEESIAQTDPVIDDIVKILTTAVNAPNGSVNSAKQHNDDGGGGGLCYDVRGV